MRTPNNGSVQYTPGDPPADPAQMQRYLRELETRIAATFAALAAGHLDKTYVAPAKPRDGDIRYADGVSWLPNGAGGVGIWYYKVNTWIQLG